MDQQILLNTSFNEFFFSGNTQYDEGFALLDDTNMLMHISSQGDLNLIGYIESIASPTHKSFFTEDINLIA